ncbi:MHC class II transactivator isoform X17 [Canis lupus familiaris]|uniref:MHC class II transactivator n=2 Tax=Canis lupus familiaris TaxID=9615 RepID=A0A8C0RXY6_CANLF|nr:MHC class II transactivator isoform X17 [Canis lupus familiaris]XP_038396309.1 MHC class II transactivator isoform X12 [Canis lupus familiaris]|eukprot:XP_005621605.1 MHC class II transactivator isoform X2 [Canis lupus familiaris]
MNHFQTILARVRMLLSSHQPSQVQALLDNMLEKELLSREYHCALLHEPDGEALARKISLTLLEKGDPDLALLRWAWSGWQTPVAEGDPNSSKDHVDSGQFATMELGPLEGGYLELLNSSTDPLQLFHLYDQTDLAREEIELFSEPDMDTINCEQFSRLLCDMEGDEETREAYANIAELDQYVFQDSQLEGLGKDIFIEHIGLEDMISETVEVLEEAGQKSQKRPEPLTVPMVTGTFLVESVSDPSALPCLSSPAIFNEQPAPVQSWLGETVLMPVPASGSLLSCLSLPAGGIQIVPSLPSLPQGLWPISGAGTGVSGMVIYQGEMPQASQVLPSSGPAVQSLPKSPDRPGSTSPFAPSAADLPGMPEPALTSRANMTEDQLSPPRCVAAHEVSSKPPKLPESVKQFCSSLRDKYQAEPAGPDGILVEVELVRARLEKSSSKSQDRELATPDWAERQLARGGLAEVLLAAGDRRRPRETQVIAVLGKAGQGKSCWAREVSRAWACGQLPQYDFVFYIPCHCLDRAGDTYRLQDLLFSLGPRPQPVDDEVFGHILRRPDRVLLILDAFEGLEGQDGACGPTSTEPQSLRGLLAGLFQRKLLRGCTLLLIARPRGRLAQSLSKADVVFEVAGFSAQQAETYMTRYLDHSGATEHRERALALLRGQPFLLSHSHSPTVCQAVCQLSEALLELGDGAKLPSTLTGLYVGLLGPAAQDSPPGALAGLARLAWELGRRHRGTLQESQFPSAEVRAWAVAKGLVRPVPGAPDTELAFSSFLLQCFLGAVWLALSSEIKDKELPQYLALTPRKKRPYDNWLEGVPRFLAGLLFQPHADCLGALAGPAGVTLGDRKQKVLSRYLKRLQPGTLRAGRLLELLHCAHEASDPALWQHVVQGLPGRLSFLGTRLTPPNAYVLGSALAAAGQDFSLDLRSTGIDPSGLGSLVGLSCVTHFRAALSDAVGLWESLQQRGETKLLRAVEEKFTIEPFKAKSPKDVEDLGNLVQIQRTRSSSEDTAGELPAVRDLKKLEFALGSVFGPQAFPKLVKILEAFSSLQHLDLDSLSENKIGDEGVEQLSATFPRLKALETLNLSQNSITDVGACKLAEALPSLAPSLLRLSLYNNYICDVGAESLAQVLPDMVSLRVLDVQYNKFTGAGAQQLAASLRKCPHVETLAMWTPTIPFGVHEHLQQLDSRISLR